MSAPVLASLESFVTFADEIDKILYLSMHAIRGLQGSGRLVRVLSKSSDLTRQKKYDDQHIQRVEEIEALALGEVEKGFPLLVSHSVVALWSALEAAIVAFCADWLVSHPECLQLESVARIRLPVAAFANADNKATMEAVVDEISQRIDAAMKPGIGRFQSLLENIGIGFGVDADLRKCLFEMSKARNLIAHKSGRVDRKFASECPWLKLQEGDPLVISLDTYRRFALPLGNMSRNSF